MFTYLFMTSETDEIRVTHSNCQQILLSAVFQDISHEFTTRINLNDTSNDIEISSYTSMVLIRKQCHIGFSKRTIRRFSMVWWTDIGNFQISYMPPTVEDMEIRACAQKYSIDIRSLPRKAKYVSLGTNYLFGDIDLSALPINLITFDLQSNRISGDISLFKLPTSLIVLDLSYNPSLKQHKVYYGKLPDSIEKIDLRETTIRHVMPILEIFKRSDVMDVIRI